MKPMKLTLSGLQSYREAQEIDFEILCEAGVFGIFGPTGSGKSTILDAVTLALYGKVERALNGTQGIMNQAENTLSVSFTFGLRGAEGPLCYRVERQFKRSSGISVNNTVSRLIRVHADGRQEVLADKASEVNARVQSLLGLTMQDFTRAVVLPQGKFAEFLALKGSERRQMLQRLFGLEAYGDLLHAQVASRFKETEAELARIAAERQGLGDASREAVKEAEDRFAQASIQAEEQREQLRHAEAEWEQKRQIREWQQEKEKLDALSRGHAEREPYIREREALLAGHERQERIRPYLDAWEAAKGAHGAAAARKAEAAARLAEAEAEHARAGKISGEAAARRAAEETPLRIRLERLREAQELAEELRRLEQEIRKLEDRRREAADRLDASGAELGKQLELKDKAIQKQTALKEELKECEVRTEERERLRLALADKEKAERLAEELANLADAHAEAERQLAESLRREAELAARMEEGFAALQPLLADLAFCGAHIRLAEADLARLEAELSAAVERAAAASRERERRRLAAVLAGQLREGGPCPVCGSLHHPAPAAAHAEAAAEGREPEALAALQQETRGLLLQARQLRFRLHHLGEQLAQQLPEGPLREAAAGLEAPGPAAAAESAPKLPPAGPVDPQEHEGGPVNPREYAAGPEERAAGIRAGLQSAEAALRGLEEAARRRLGELQRLAAARQEAEAAAKARREVAAQALTRKRQAAEAAARAGAEWASKYPGLAPEQAAGLYAEAARKDRRAEELRSRLETSVPYIEGVQRRIEALRQQRADLEKRLVELASRLEHTARLRTEKARQLAERAGSEPLAGQLAAAESRLRELAEAEQAGRALLERAQAALQAAGQRHSAAAEAYAAAADALAKAEAAWLNALEGSPFASAEEVRAAALSEADREAWAAEAARHREQEKQLAGRRQRILELLAGRSVAEPEWTALQERLAALRTAREQALQARARAERDLEELRGRHERWIALEKRRAVLAELHGRLSRLQSVLRGNAFVEFVAEEQLLQVCRAASERLSRLTRQRYALEIDSGGGFVIRDDANGGVRRPVTTLSGGETFLASLSLALALSAQIQLRGQYPLEFFFLDEGFGTLDPDLLETVVTALEKLHMDKLTVGVISHVPELRARLPRRLIVHPAEPTGRGSRVDIETL